MRFPPLESDPFAAVVDRLWPVGSIYLSAVSTNPADLLGIGTWVAVGAGRVLVGVDPNDTDFNAVLKTGGAKTVASAGSNSAPAFTGNQVSTSSVSAGTPTGTISAPTFTGSAHTLAGTIAWPGSVPTHSGITINAVTTTSGSFKGTNTGGFSAIGGAAPGSSFTPTINSQGTIAWPAAVPTYSGESYTPAGTVSAPTFTGSALSAHSHTVTPTGTVAAPTFTGSATSVVQPYLCVYMWQRTA